MIKFIVLFLSIVSLEKDTWERSIDVHDGVTYIQVAEDLIAKGIHTPYELKLIEQLFVLSAVVDPYLRESAILGIVSIERDHELRQQVLSMRSKHSIPFVQSAIASTNTSAYIAMTEVDTIATILRSIRGGKAISQEQTNALKPFGHLFTSGFDSFLQRVTQRRRTISKKDIDTTLKIEIDSLGGATLWSADYRINDGRPVAITINDDLATLMQINPTKIVRRNGKWEQR